MANIKITDLNASTNPASTDVLAIVDVGADETKKVSIADLMENAGAGTEALPGIAFDGDPNTGIYRPGADQLAISTAGTGRLFIDSCGRVGIGEASSAAEFQISGSNPSLYLKPNADTETSEISFRNAANTQSRGYIAYLHANDALTFRTNNTGEMMRLDSSGRLGLGTSSPSKKLTIVQDGADSALRIEQSGEGYNIYRNQVNGYLYFDAPQQTFSGYNFSVFPTGGSLTSALFIQNSGNVGIGTNSPGDKLHVDGGALRVQNGTGVPYVILAGRSTDGRSELGFRNNAASSDLARIVGQTSALSIDVAGAERARIDNSGRLGLGTSSPGQKLTVASSDTSVTAIQIANSATGVGATDGFQFSVDANGYTYITNKENTDLYISTNNQIRSTIKNDGKVGIGATSVDEHLHIEGIGTQRVKIEATDTSIAGLVMLNTNRRYDIQVNGSDLQFYDNTGSAERMRLDSNGRLGVGTSSPSALIHTSEPATGGDAAVIFQNTGNSNAATNVKIKALQSTANSNGGEITFGRENSFNWGVGTSCDGYIALSPVVDNVNTERLRITSGGNVGIGTNSPNNLLHVRSGGSSRVALFGDSVGNNEVAVTRITTSPSFISLKASSNVGAIIGGPTLAFSTAAADGTSGTERARIDSSGTFRVKGAGTAGTTDAVQLNGAAPANSLLLDGNGRLGLGTSTPGQLLHLSGGSPALQLQPSADSQNSLIIFRNAADSTTKGLIYYNHSNDSLNFTTNGTTTDAVIDSSGNVGIGTASASYLLDLGSASGTVDNAAVGIRIRRSGTSNSWGKIDNTSGSFNIDQYNSSSPNIRFRTSTDGSTFTERARITSDGYLRLASGSGGIQFDGDTAAANALDDYEEGVFTVTMTPNTSGTISLFSTANALSYTKIGSFVYVTGRIEVQSVASPVGTRVTIPLPFQAKASGGDQEYRTGGTVQEDVLGTASSSYQFEVNASATNLLIRIDASTIAASDGYRFNFGYTAA
jgi:hypothetical protein